MKKQKQQKLFSKKKTNKSKNKDNYQKNAVQVVEQRETSQNNSSKIEDILKSNFKKKLTSYRKKAKHRNK